MECCFEPHFSRQLSDLSDGYNIRISGQDVERGTFSHRHAILTYEDSTETISPLNNISKEANFEIYNSHLSEYGVLGFEYGYSISMPKSLVTVSYTHLTLPTTNSV